MKVLILCTQNSARSQIAEALFRELSQGQIEVYSAGFEPAIVNPYAIRVMEELKYDMSAHRSKSMDEFQGMFFDYVVTVCSNAENRCPLFPNTTKRLRWPTDDPAAVIGTDKEKMTAFRNAREFLRLKIVGFVEDIK